MSEFIDITMPILDELYKAFVSNYKETKNTSFFIIAPKSNIENLQYAAFTLKNDILKAAVFMINSKLEKSVVDTKTLNFDDLIHNYYLVVSDE